MFPRCHSLFSACACLAAVIAARSSPAALMTGGASASGVESTVEIVQGLAELQIGPTPSVSGTAPAAFNSSDSIASINQSATANIAGLGDVPIITLSTTVVSVDAMSDVDGAAGSRLSSASATVDDLQFAVDTVSGLLVVSSLVSLQATSIQSSAMLSGVSGALMATGSTTLAGTAGPGGDQAVLTVLGVDFLLDITPAPNTMFTINGTLVPGLTGTIDVFLNEQTTTGNLMDSGSLDVNAVRLQFNNVEVGLGPTTELLNGSLILASSSALLATPEPASMGLCLLFLLAAGWHHLSRESRSRQGELHHGMVSKR